VTKGFKFLTCPDCGKKGVYFAMRSHGEDNFSCRYCDFYFFTLSESPRDTREEERLKASNPGCEL
jgi:tRNA(Ile2) C34 agmatinyltransferase TiaS